MFIPYMHVFDCKIPPMHEDLSSPLLHCKDLTDFTSKPKEEDLKIPAICTENIHSPVKLESSPTGNDRQQIQRTTNKTR